MKKNLEVAESGTLISFQNIKLIIKTTVCIVIAIITNIYGSQAYSQAAKISLNLTDVKVVDVLNEIQSKSEFEFFYNNKLIDTDRIVSINVENKDIGVVLSELFDTTDVNFVVKDNYIILTNQLPAVEKKSANTLTVKGNVTSQSGDPIIGVTVAVKGISTGTITDVNGNYFLSNIPGNTILIFSFIGMKTQEIPVNNRTIIDVTMVEDMIAIEEVVAIGYGTQKRRDAIGSLASVNNEKLMNPAYTNFTDMLQGKASGVFVSNGAIRVRGINSISNATDPLYVIDGVATSGNFVNPNDIESIEILKDASATAIYGSRAAGGVIMVTTKSGKKGTNIFNVTLNGGITSFLNDGFERADASTHLAAMDLAIQNANKYDPSIEVRPYDPKDAFSWNVKFQTDENGEQRNFDYFTRDYVKDINVDQLKEITRLGDYKEVNLTSSKSFSTDDNLYFSMNYRGEKGVYEGDEGNKLNARLGFNFNPTKNLKLGVISSALYNKHTNGGWLSPSWLPFMPFYDNTNPTGLWVPAANPVSFTRHDLIDNNQSTKGFTIKLIADYSIPFVEGLSIKANIGSDYANALNSNWSSLYMNSATGLQPYSTAYAHIQNTYNLLGNIGLNYNRTFGDHTISAVVFQEAQKIWVDYLNTSAEKLSSYYHEIGVSPGTMLTMSQGLNNEFRLMSTLGRVMYKFRNKYLFEGSLRSDATSKFSPEERTAVFGSLGGGWIITDESFFQDLNSGINLLKLRGSIGQTGNGNMPDFKFMNVYATEKYFMGQQFTYIRNIGNSVITWETSNNLDLGLDFGIFKNRVNGSFAFYKKSIDDLLLEVPLPLSSGIIGNFYPVGGVKFTPTIWQNIGEMVNSGFEMNVSYFAVKKTNLSWEISGNFSTLKNEIISLHPAIDAKGWGIEGYKTITRTGGKLAEYYLPEYAGIDPQKGIPMIHEMDQDIYATTGESVKTGNIIPLNSVTGAANRFIQKEKSGMPSWFGGFASNTHYKDFELNLNFSFAADFYFLNQAAVGARGIGNTGTGDEMLAKDILENSWKKPGDIAKYGELLPANVLYYDSNGNSTTTSVQPHSSFTTQDMIKGNYLKLKVVTFSYNLPQDLLAKAKISNLKLYMSINNAFIFSKAPKEIDPELNIPGNIDASVVFYGLPPTRVLSFGLLVNL